MEISRYLGTLPDEESRLPVQFVELWVARGTGSAEEGLHLDHPIVELKETVSSHAVRFIRDTMDIWYPVLW